MRAFPNHGSLDYTTERSRSFAIGSWTNIWRNKFHLAALMLLLVGCREQVLHDLSESEANRLISRLSQVKIESQKELQADGRWSLAVGKGDALRALTFIDSSRLMVRRANGSTVDSSAGFLPSREESWLRYQRALASGVEDTLLAMPGVVEARVHVNLTQADPLLGRRGDTSGSGSVLLVVDRAFESTDDAIASLVGGAAGIEPGLIKVLRSSTDGGGGSLAPDIIEAGDKMKSLSEAALPMKLVHGVPVGKSEVIATVGILLVGIGLLIRRRISKRAQNPFLLEREE